jgi:hypothetical protein
MKRISALVHNQRGVTHLIAIAVIGVLLFIFISSAAPFQNKLLSGLFPKPPSHASSAFLATFDGLPTTPQPFLQTPTSANWDVAVHSRDSGTLFTLDQMEAQHGPDCAPPIDATGRLVTHHFDGDYNKAVFQCKDHIMTSMNEGGYGLIYLTPNKLADFSSGEVVITVDVSTLRTSGRDWWDVWVTPYEDNLQLPFDAGDVDLQGVPRRSIHMKMDSFSGGTIFYGGLIDNFTNTDLGSCWWCTIEDKMTTSPQQRTKFELRISKTHVKFSIPGGQLDVKGNPINGGQPIVWVDKEIAPLSWDKGVVQLGHHSYNPRKDCTPDPIDPYKQCYPNTWHWDNVSISNTIPFTIIKADKRVIPENTTDQIIFNQPAPVNSYLRFSAILAPLQQVSFDNGATWQDLQRQAQPKDCMNGHMCNFWMPIPQGVQKVIYKSQPSNTFWWGSQGIAKDFSIWSSTVSSQPTQTPSSLPTPTPAVTLTPTPLPSPTPTIVPTPVPTVSSNPIAGPTVTKLVNCLSGPTTFNVITLNYSGVDWVDISSDSTFPLSGFYNKQVTGTTSTQGPSGFNLYPDRIPSLVINPNTTYFTRGFVSSSANHVNGSSFSFNLCTTATPPPTSKPGDINGDGLVNIFDYNLLLTNFGKTGTGIQGDVDGNNKVDIFDYNILLGNFGK